jgi:hypothetical protein
MARQVSSKPEKEGLSRWKDLPSSSALVNGGINRPWIWLGGGLSSLDNVWPTSLSLLLCGSAGEEGVSNVQSWSPVSWVFNRVRCGKPILNPKAQQDYISHRNHRLKTPQEFPRPSNKSNSPGIYTIAPPSWIIISPTPLKLLRWNPWPNSQFILDKT